MKRILMLAILAILLCGTAARAQSVRGRVVDKSGVPIPGVKVEDPATGQYTITEFDGSFELESDAPVSVVQVMYSGMQSKKQKVSPDMTIVMVQTNWWNKRPDKFRFFVGAQMLTPEQSFSNPAYGLMLGQVKDFGWYLKGALAPGQKAEEGLEVNAKSPYWRTGTESRSLWTVSAGAIVRLGCPLHLYAGAGYIDRAVNWELADGVYARNTDYSYKGLAADAGVLFRVGHFAVNGGVMLPVQEGISAVIGQFGIAFVF